MRADHSTRALVDARALHDQHSRHRGFGRYVWQLLAALGATQGVRISALADGSVQLPDGIRRRRTRRVAPGRYLLVEHAARLTVGIALTRPDVFHSPAFDPPTWSTRPWVQTLHDVTPMAFPHPWFSAMSDEWTRRAMRMTRATLVVAVSQSAADDGARYLGMDPARVRVIHHGVDPVFRQATKRVEPDPPYLLVVGGWGPNKGYEEAFEVVSRMARLGYSHRLRIAGRQKAADQVEVDRLLAVAGRPDRVDLLGLVPDAELVRLYQGAAAVLVPSRYEGFGLPALEAMACGAPVIAFANSSLPEVIGDGGTLVPDGDTGAMTDAVVGIIRTSAARERASVAGVTRARLFAWSTAARRYAEVYAECAAAGSR